MNLGRRASFFLPLSLIGCSEGKTPQATAEAFIDRYYIERNHSRALELAADGAAVRVREEKKLVEGNPAGAYAGVQPQVRYQLVKETPKGEDAELLYALSIDSSGVKLHKELRLWVKKTGGVYKVVFFDERDVSAK
ncbi:MAG: hypothetical protein ACOZIN_10095 [Myxococcota bacterium]